MKSIKDLMKELGWEKNPQQNVAEAFLKNLNQAIDKNQKPTPLKLKPCTIPEEEIQMSFNFEGSQKRSS